MVSSFSVGSARLIVAVFGFFLALPVTLFLTGTTRIESSASSASSLPPVSALGPGVQFARAGVSEWLNAFKSNYGLRMKMIEWYGLIKVGLFHSSTDHRVRLGSDGWLFYADGGITDFHRHSFPFTSAELGVWRSVLERRQTWLKSQGISYVMVIAPDSHSVYGKRHLKNITWGSLTRTDQLVEALRTSLPELRLVDMRPEIIRLSEHTLTYHKTDTHWNAASGYYATCAVRSALDGSMASCPTPPLLSSAIKGGDLARMLGLQAHFDDMSVVPDLPPLPLYDAQGLPYLWKFHDIVLRTYLEVYNPEGKGTALVLRDSFGEAMMPYLSRYFAKTVWVWSDDFSRSQIRKLRPDVVVTQVVERRLFQLRPVAFKD